ncbi:hypothetical protein ACO0M4_15360 [Streptomyces sp. RGM 3693]|uniref:hypothetical protein n=1 Tax=Streptomyces sp. RGM 3693 TaxID=3413284 RepID=UPI003D27D70A
MYQPEGMALTPAAAPAVLTGLAARLPPPEVTDADLRTHLGTSDTSATWNRERLGTSVRRRSDPKTTTGDLAAEAGARTAVAETLGVPPERVPATIGTAGGTPPSPHFRKEVALYAARLERTLATAPDCPANRSSLRHRSPGPAPFARAGIDALAVAVLCIAPEDQLGLTDGLLPPARQPSRR